jgi:hypothetical protein
MSVNRFSDTEVMNDPHRFRKKNFYIVQRLQFVVSPFAIIRLYVTECNLGAIANNV